MATYYGYEINVTNCFSGNEKGHVEGSVKIIRNHVFATNYEFITFEDAQDYLLSQLIEMNVSSKIEEEKLKLLPYKPKLELANISITILYIPITINKAVPDIPGTIELKASVIPPIKRII